MNSRQRTLLIQIVLFIATLITTTIAGAEWMRGSMFWYDPTMGWHEFLKGFQFSIPFLGILTAHEFGHYFTAKKHKTRVTLPYYFPLWVGPLPILSIGTMGAFIRIKQKIKSRLKFFDIGIAGPLAGFVVAVAVLFYAFLNLPPAGYIFTIHPNYLQFGLDFPKFVYQAKAGELLGATQLGDSFLFNFFKNQVANPAFLPHPNEITHYPFIFAGYLALFFTSLNLIPIGQLDGGHILYGLIGDKAFRIVSPILFTIFAFYAGLGFFTFYEFQGISNQDFLEKVGYFLLFIYFNYLCFSKITDNKITNLMISLSVVVVQILLTYFMPNLKGYEGFLAFVFLLGRFLGVYHPQTSDTKPLGIGRQIIGWLALIIFIISFSPKPFIFV